MNIGKGTIGFYVSVVAVLLLAMPVRADSAAELEELVKKTAASEQQYRLAQELNGGEDARAAASLKIAYEKALAELDARRIELLAEYAEFDTQDLKRRRSAGTDWITLATELGVHPSVIGIQIIDDSPPPFRAPD